MKRGLCGSSSQAPSQHQQGSPAGTPSFMEASARCSFSVTDLFPLPLQRWFEDLMFRKVLKYPWGRLSGKVLLQ